MLRTPDASILSHVMDAYDRGQMLEALRRAQEFAPLREWSGVNACIVAARIAANTGAPQLSTRLTVRARRAGPNDAAALAQYGYEVLNRRGPLAAWKLLRGCRDDDSEIPIEQQCELLALRSIAAADLRDFAAAEELITRADAMGPRAWVRVQRAFVLHRQDRLEEALDVIQSAIALHPHPFYRPAVQVRAQLLQELDRDDEAIAVLTEAEAATESGPVAAQLYALLSENGRWSEAETALDRYGTLSPLLEPSGSEWLLSQRARVVYHLGRRVDAMAFAEKLDDSFHKAFAARLANEPEQPEHAQLDVTFVRQHFKTCAPATLAAIGNFWAMPAEHVKLAEAMCYDGTPQWQQRDWAEHNGWFVREFRLTQESAIALIERGIPFAISCVDATSAHMMALIGFDKTRGTLLLRDPSQPYIVEVQADEFLKRYRAFGPRAAVFLPAADRERIANVNLPDADVYDVYHQFWLAISRHDRERAAQMVNRIEAEFTDHPLAWNALQDLASYDANIAEQARCLDKLLELFPGNPTRLLMRFGCLRDASRAERLEFLQRVCADKRSDSIFFIELARVLHDDGRAVGEARRWLKRAQRFRPMDSSCLHVEADLLWAQADLEMATELYRFAANLEGYREDLYRTWFVACRRTRQADRAVAYLEDRFVRFGARSEQPALTLAWAWYEMEQPARARSVLNEAMRLRPQDGVLKLRGAYIAAHLYDNAEADKLLDAAKGLVREHDWLHVSMQIAQLRVDLPGALKRAKEILALEPLALDAHNVAAVCLANLESPAAALEHLKEVSARFPHNFELKKMILNWSRTAGSAAVEQAARELLQLDPSDGWSRRELAVALIELDRSEEALQEAAEAARIEPLNSYSFSLIARVYEDLRRFDDARAEFRHAVQVNVDNSDALRGLLRLSSTDKERKEELGFIQQQLIRQVVTGDGLLAFIELARPALDAETLLSELRDAHRERPDLWQAWSALVSQLGHMQRFDEALDIARQSTERFGHLPRVWLDLVFVYRWRNELADEIATAARAFEMNPAWSESTVAFADALERADRLEDARRIYERAQQHSKDDAHLHALHAHLLWRLREREEAFEVIKRCLRLAPGYGWAWDLFQSWAGERGQRDRVEEFARTLSEQRPGELRVWLMLSRILEDPSQIGERLKAVNRAVSLDPHSSEAWDLKVEILARAEKFEEAIEACNEAWTLCPNETHVFRGRLAWIEAQRRRLPEAIRLMRDVLADNSGYVWGWNQYALWLVEQGELNDAALAFEHLRQLRPHDAWILRQLGFLRLRQNDRAAAIEAFTAAVHGDPTDGYAAHNLFDLQLELPDLTDAAATIALMETHQPGTATRAAEIRLLLRQKKTVAARVALESLCASADPNAWAIDTAVDAFARAGLASDALKILKNALANPSCNPQTGTAALRLLAGRRKWLSSLILFSKIQGDESRRRAAAVIAEGLTKLQGLLGGIEGRLSLRWLLWRDREVFRSDDFAWGQVGYAFIHFNQSRSAARWLSDWRSRDGVQPWMLFNLCLALRNRGEYDESTTVVKHALAVWGHRHGATDLRLFLAVEEALHGSLVEARKNLETVVVRQDVRYDQALLAVAKGAVELRETPRENRSRQFKKIRKQLDAHFSFKELSAGMKDMRLTFKRASQLFWSEGAGWQAMLWFSWKLYGKWIGIAVWAAIVTISRLL